MVSSEIASWWTAKWLG